MMPDQLSLPGIDASPRPSSRLFFAVFPEPDVAQRIGDLADDLQQQSGLKGSKVGRARLHVTLYHLGDYEELPGALVRDAREAADEVVGSSFNACFDHVSSFSGKPGHNPLVLLEDEDTAAWNDLWLALGLALKKAGLGRFTKPFFTPHVTMMYGDHALSKQAIDPVSWTVNDFALVHSLLGQTKHIHLHRWKLKTCRS